MSAVLSLEHITEVMTELRAYQGRIVVIKIGGNSIAEDDLFLSKVARQAAFLSINGVRVVLVHGGGPQIDAALHDKKVPVEKGKDGRRITSPRAMKIVAQVMKKMNLAVGAALAEAGCDKNRLLLAARMLRPVMSAAPLDSADPQNRSGTPQTADAKLILRALDAGKIVALHSLGIGEGGRLYNINGDDYAMAVAIAVKAKRLILVTNVAGVLGPDRERVPFIDRVSARQLIEDGTISGGMVPKVQSALEVVKQGVNGVAIIDGFHPWAILAELLTHEGLGTLFRSGGF